MMDVHYSGEHIWPHYLGNLFLLIIFYSGIFILLLHFTFKAKDSHTVWFKWAYHFQFTGILLTIGLLLYIMYSKYYEYQYVWTHVSDELPLRFLLSGFWEGQEGSFLLWMFWNACIGSFFLKDQNRINRIVLVCIVGVQVLLCSMLLGIYLGDYRLGSNPFVLLRQMIDAPIFSDPEYVSKITGKGMNPLLQNYWMLIHPPTLFFGFAATVVPWAYSLAALTTGDFQTWVKKSLRWSLIAAAILGLGILMGSAWAYEALSFGGYWAWDPVENMSLVPWILLLAGVHTHFIVQNTRRGFHSLFIYYILSFLLVLYSTYLTRSGILGESSAHAFTQMGLEYQLVFLLASLAILSISIFLKKYKIIPKIKDEEKLLSREFWLFVAALVLLFSAGLIGFTTSIPVYNKIVNQLSTVLDFNAMKYLKNGPIDPIDHHNRFQLWIAVCICLTSSLALLIPYYTFLTTERIKTTYRIFIVTGIISMSIGGAILYYFPKYTFSNFVLMSSAIGMILMTLLYFHQNKHLWNKKFSTTVSHIGFGVFIMGVLISGVYKQYITLSQNISLIENENAESKKHFMLQFGKPSKTESYELNYLAEKTEKPFTTYLISVKDYNVQGQIKDSFILKPSVQRDYKNNKIVAYIPYVKHQFSHDIFVHVAQSDESQASQKALDELRLDLRVGRITGSLRLDSFCYQSRQLDTSSLFVTEPHYLFYLYNENQLDPGKLPKSEIILEDKQAVGKNQDPEYQNTTIRSHDSTQFFLQSYRKRKQSFKLSQGQHIQLVGLGDISLGNIKHFIKKSINDNNLPEIIHIMTEVNIKGTEINTVLKPVYLISNQIPYFWHDISKNGEIILSLTGVDPLRKIFKFEIEYNTSQDIPPLLPILFNQENSSRKFLILQMIHFPGIILVWLGGMMMVAGLITAAMRKNG